jgi:nucleolar protein 14
MPPSQLKQLKASLRDQGLAGPQKSKKQKKAAVQDAGTRHRRNVALQAIRERFNPFEVKAPARKEKFEIVSSRNDRPRYGLHGRPGVTKGVGEEMRRATLLKEIHNRNKVGQIVDRRFGENDPTMTPEQRAAERFARQSERQFRKKSMFNLEDEAEDNIELTHMGRSLNLGESSVEDEFKEADLEQSDGDVDRSEEVVDKDYLERPSKRRRLSIEDGDAENGASSALQLPERKKSKQEIMKEVVAKSKTYKYERQQAKEDDDDLRAELDKGLPEFLDLLHNYRKPDPSALSKDESSIAMNPDRAALLAGQFRKEADREYNERVRQMAFDQRSKPSTRTKTEEEKAEEDSARLRALEEERRRRMEGEPGVSDDEHESGLNVVKDDGFDDAEAFGFAPVSDENPERRSLDVEDEDEFVLDDDLVASDSQASMATDDAESSDEGEEEEDVSALDDDDGDDDFINSLVLPAGAALGSYKYREWAI